MESLSFGFMSIGIQRLLNIQNTHNKFTLHIAINRISSCVMMKVFQINSLCTLSLCLRISLI